MQINEDDAVMLHELASLTSAQLKDKIDCLLKLSYQLGMQESHEMTRGKFLNVLPKELWYTEFSNLLFPHVSECYYIVAVQCYLI